MQQCNNRTGFTLVELLIVIAILGILGGGIIAAINPLAKINSANLAKAKTFSASVENGLAIDQVGKWSFEDGAGATSFKDTSGYNTSGSCSGTTCPTWTSAASCGLGLGGCLYFDGSSNYVSAPLPFFDTETISLWVKTVSASDKVVFSWSQGANGGYSDRYVQINADGNVVWYVWNKFTLTTAGINVRDNQWHNIIVFGKNNASDNIGGKIYVDGVEKSRTSIDGRSDAVNDNTINIGSWSGGFFNGFIDEVTIYNQALSLSQIQQLYAQGLEKHQLASRVEK